MYLCKETQSMLNEQALLLSGAGATFNVYYWGVNPQLFDNPIHRHSFFEVCYVMDGEGEYMDNGINYSLRKGTHFCSKPGVTHQIRTQNGLFLLYVAFEIDESRSQETVIEAFRSLAQSGAVCLQAEDESPTSLLWRSLLMHERIAGALPLHAVLSTAHALLLSFSTLFGVHEPIQTIKHSSATLLRQAKLYIRDNLSQPLNLRGVAKYLNISERHLSRLFAFGIHENFTNYIRHERIREASRLLATSELSIKEIAEMTGFSSVHYFTRVFMKDKEVPPGQFRRRYHTSSPL
ncbi:AraC-like DNA-binding protein/mannose-6-phosphate isomerase-like protein (cupin superfamily) [Paenibacillus castaneae]|uniref:AraC family transcriptional regulator n=1 Tax=Paenibacillus castaneae TaxID=474957 RepID=UPI000C9A24FB|nr:AraC family transcriptional regulator [Paenibacillus castaneae]NIK79010.1 AraC-like DNA-binding protein/mannose-6-phosphate isomerase-like protein (cupin superfamily) [Paenibacillus castaneae]